MSQRARVLRIIALATLPLVVLLGVSLWRDLKESEARIGGERVALARAAALTAEAVINGNLSTVRTLAITPHITDPASEAELQSYLAQVLAENPGWEGIGLVGADGWNRDGRNRAGSRTLPGTLYVGDRQYFRETLATGRPTVSSAIVGRASDLPTVVLAAPVDSAQGSPSLLIAPLPTGRLAEALRAQIGTASRRITVIDRDGQAFIHPDPEHGAPMASIRGRPDVEAALAGETGSSVLDLGGVETLVAYAPVPAVGWGVLVAEPAALAFAPIRGHLVQQLGLLSLVLAAVGWMSWYLGGRLSLFYSRLVEARGQAEAARADAELAAQRSAFLAEASRQLAGSLEYEATLAVVARLAVPDVADWCAVDVLDESGNFRRLSVAHGDPAEAEVADGMAGGYSSALEGAGALKTGECELDSEISDALLEARVRDPERLRTLRSLGPMSAMLVPLVARGRTLGALHFVSAVSRRRYGATDLIFAEQLASRAAMAVDHARLYREAQQAVATRDEFLASASHDLKNPLTSIKVIAQVLQLQLERSGTLSSERLKEALDGIDATATRMAGLIGAMLDVARLEMGRPLDLERRPTDLAALTRELAAEREQLSQRHQIRVEGEQALVGAWDAARLQRVVGNLLDNAVKYDPNGGNITVSLAREGGTNPLAVLTVRDEGIGIPEEELPMIFERFHRGNNVVGRIPGTGLGLAGALQIVEQHGGTIVVDSREGVGTTVTVRLPVGSEAEADGTALGAIGG